MNHNEDYPPEYLAGILKAVKTIAMVGASSDPTKFSYGVLRVLYETGYDMIPVNPQEAGKEIRGLKCYESLASIEEANDVAGKRACIERLTSGIRIDTEIVDDSKGRVVKRATTRAKPEKA